jgi:hypothetical protein
MVTRQELNQAVAKFIAFKNCGKANEANHWAETLKQLVEYANNSQTKVN